MEKQVSGARATLTRERVLEAAVALAIVLALYRNYGSVNADNAQSLKR